VLPQGGNHTHCGVTLQTGFYRNYRNPVNQANSTQLKQGSASITDTSVFYTERSDEQQQTINYFNKSSR